MICQRLFLFLLLCTGQLTLFGQISFTRHTELLTPQQHYSGVAIAVADANGDGRDDILRMNQGFRLAIEFQIGPGQPFFHQPIVDLNSGSQWGMCVADVDNNGFADVLAGGLGDRIKVVQLSSDGQSHNLVQLDAPSTFVQGVNFADLNNDGWLDAFVCHDDGLSRIFLNDSAGALIYAPQTIDMHTVPPSDGSGNYGSVWSDVDNDGDTDLYIAKCRQGVTDPTSGMRINQLFWNNGDGTFTQDTANVSGLRIGAQSWTADFGDIDNDGDFDCFITNHDVSSQLLENDGSGHFTDITEAAGLLDAIDGLPIQGVFRDFDNDGYADILVAGQQHFLFRNSGAKTFAPVPVLGDTRMESFALGDLNADGFQDIYAGYAEIFTDPSTTPDALWLNDGNANHYFGLNLRGVQSNRSAVGARVFLYSPFGIQTREVRSGESYGIMNSMQVHFGLGAFTAIDSVVIRWPSGQVDVLPAPAVDQYMTVVEKTCAVPAIRLEADAPLAFCTGDSVRLSVGSDFDFYFWNTGSAEPSIVVHEPGPYMVTVTAAPGCTAVSDVVTVTVDPVETPTITASGDSTFCRGGSLTLTASAAAAYAWNTGDTTASIVVTETGWYAVTTQGQCAQFNSTPLQVTVLEAPLPVPLPDTVALYTSASLSAGGNQLIWYDAAAGGNILYAGNPFLTPPLAESTTYWVANNALYDLPNQFTGMKNHMGSNFASLQTNGSIVFDCLSPVRLKRVKVYTNKAAQRRIDLLNAAGAVLQSALVDIPVGTTVIDLNFDLPVGTGLVLTTHAETNQQTLGSFGPQLRRSDEGVAYPYEIPGFLRLKSSNFGTDRYYYFYDWEVDFPGHTCLSDRVAVTAVVDTSLVSAAAVSGAAAIRISPNPGGGAVLLDWPEFKGGLLQVTLYTMQGSRVALQRFEPPAGALRLPLAFGPLPKGAYWLELSAAGQAPVRRKILIQ
ncbi:MAG: CRTAC1 family protein [Saprospirales bacterium]|nr:CRTAC1 family protein [Saprospirales bacterium]